MIYLNLIRISQWIKNLLIFATPIAIGNFKFIFSFKSIIFFISFSLFVSSTYIINDLKDVESDKLHPQKKYRPLASGKISASTAIKIFFVQFLFSLIIIFIIDSKLLVLSLGYLTLTLLYTYKFKYKKYFDILTIAILFLSRLYIGSFFFNIPVSSDLFIVVFFLSIVLVTSKKYSIRNNAHIRGGKVHNFLISSYTNRTLLVIISISSVMSSLGMLYWIFDKKYFQIVDSALISYFLIFFLYEILLFILFRLTKKQKTEDFSELLYESKLLKSLIISIMVLYIFQII